ncbi:unnamed protein product [Ambrosiozyma monospora]|uniref:Unnamed protein product n=1 Tax=Ambrosiozyma monospora TaxID=43982 RepID=A0ACB5T8E1_AMBMO|nr:unnamed protein product [Ambrosiozyma monospora]
MQYPNTIDASTFRMVLRSFANFSRSSSTYIPRRASNSYTHPFFNPSYVKPKELAPAEEVTNKNSRNKTNNSYPINPAISIGNQYVVIDPSKKKKKDDDENSEDQRIIFKKVGNKSAKNGLLNVTIQSVTPTETILKIRRSNSNTFKTLTLKNASLLATQARSYATLKDITTKEVEEQLAKLKLQEVKESAEEEQVAKSAPESPETLVDPVVATQPEEVLSEEILATKTPLEIQEIVIDNLISMNKNDEIRVRNF